MSAPTTEPLPAPGEGLRRVRLDVGYDGAGFAGWARQPGLRTVEGVLLDALVRVTGDPGVVVVCAGRTDAGVHARGQVCHADIDARRLHERLGGDVDVLRRRLAGALPDDVRIGAVAAAAPGFDARFSALRRHYAYRLCDDPAGPDPLVRGFVVAHPRPLDVAAMNRAAALLLGEHDFAAFCRRRDGASTVRELLRFRWRREPPTSVLGPADADAPGQARDRDAGEAEVPGAARDSDGREADASLIGGRFVAGRPRNAHRSDGGETALPAWASAPAAPAAVEGLGTPPAGLVVAEVVADAFCHSMVRALVGALVPVGDGWREESWPAKVLASRQRHPGVVVMPARGLVLEQVDYPPADQLAARQRATRRFRG